MLPGASAVSYMGLRGVQVKECEGLSDTEPSGRTADLEGLVVPIQLGAEAQSHLHWG